MFRIKYVAREHKGETTVESVAQLRVWVDSFIIDPTSVSFYIEKVS